MRGRSLVTIVTLPLVVVSRRSVVPLLPVPVLSVPVVPVPEHQTVTPSPELGDVVPVLVVSLPLLVPGVAVVVIPVVSVARWAVVIPVVSCRERVTNNSVLTILTSVIVARGWSPVVVPVPLLVVPVLPLVMSIAMISSTSAAAFTEPEARASSLAVMEIDPRSGSVGGTGDGEVDTDLKS